MAKYLRMKQIKPTSIKLNSFLMSYYLTVYNKKLLVKFFKSFFMVKFFENLEWCDLK